MKLWLDDERPAPDGWTWAKTAGKAIELLASRDDITEVSLDHDLGDLDDAHKVNGDGYDVLLMIEADVHAGRMLEFPRIEIHTANPAARKRMVQARDAIERARQNARRGSGHG